MIELVDKRSRNGKIFDLGNGKFRAEIGGHSHVLKNGLWIPTQTDIDSESGTDADSGLAYILKSRSDFLDYDIKFGKNDPVWMKIKHIPTGNKIVFKPKQNRNNPDHAVIGNKISVSQAWDGIDMEIFVTDKGIKSNYIITSASGQRIVEFDVSGDVASFKQGAPFYKPSGSLLPVVLPSSFSSGVLSYDFRTVPVGTVVDPTVTIQPSGAETLDAILDDGNPNFSYAAYDFLYIGDIGAVANVGLRSVLKIPLSGLDGLSITKAILTLTAYDGTRTNGPTAPEININRLLREFVEATATWNVASTGNAWGTAGCANGLIDLNSTPTASISPDKSAVGEHTWDVTADIIGFVDGTFENYGWRISAPSIENLGSHTNYWAYRASEYATASERPKLTIEYGSAATQQNPYPFARASKNNPFRTR